MEPKIKTLSDLPATEDAINAKPYIDALSEFIQGCNTPMAIGIQGGWGSGKSSMLQMIQQRIAEANCLCIPFNTWQYSQFNGDEMLSISLMRRLVFALETQIPTKGGDREEQGKKIKAVLHGLLAAGTYVVSEQSKLVGTFVEAVQKGKKAYDKVLEERQEYAEKYYESAISPLETLKEDIAKYVQLSLAAQSKAQFTRKDRVVVFIDDLDRLEPIRAIELLESLKLFLDVTGCVFVLAVDFDVVKQGVKAKYGDGIGGMKAMAYFDKIIQVPFLMPTYSYDVANYLMNILEMPHLSGREKQSVLALARKSVGNNPRSLKRLANSFGLLRHIIGKTAKASDVSSPLGDRDEAKVRDFSIKLFANLCMQAGFPLLYPDVTARILELLDGRGNDSDAPTGDMLQMLNTLLPPSETDSATISDPESKGTGNRVGDEGGSEEGKGGGADNSLDLARYRSIFSSEEISLEEFVRFSEFFQLYYAAFLTNEGDIDVKLLEVCIKHGSVTHVSTRSDENESAGSHSTSSNIVTQLEESGFDKAQIGLYRKLESALENLVLAGEARIEYLTSSQNIVIRAVTRYPTRGVIARVIFNKASIIILLGSTYHSTDDIASWCKVLSDASFKVTKLEKGAHAISLRRVTFDQERQSSELSRVLKEVVDRTVQHFGTSADTELEADHAMEGDPK